MSPPKIITLSLYIFFLSLAPLVFTNSVHLHPAITRRLSLPATESSGPVISRNGTVLPPYTKVYTFDQLIDHQNPEKGNLQAAFLAHLRVLRTRGGNNHYHSGRKQRGRFYQAAYHISYLTNQTMPGLIAQQQSGSAIVIEHRYFGLSNPQPDLSVQSLKLLTIQQAIDDLEYFAYNVHLPMPNGDQLTPDKAPWILMGGSYAGALTAWTMVKEAKPGVFFAGYASSAVVEAIYDFWKFYEPIREHMPKNCSADVEGAIVLLDKVLMGDDQKAIQELKDSFGMSEVQHLDDFAAALQQNFLDWQKLQVFSGPGSLFYNFCDALEVKNGKSAPASGWGAAHALSAWGAYFKDTYLNILCSNRDISDCFDTYNTTAPFYTSTAIDNENRSWFWMVCNEVGFIQAAAPARHPPLISRLIQPPAS